MPGLEKTVEREPLHRRSIEIHGYKRADGLFDIEGHLVDTKPVDIRLSAGIRKAGDPVHDMWLRITVDRGLRIVDASASMDAMPYIDQCDNIEPAYRKLIGLTIGPGYSRQVKELLGGVRGCTHVTELAGILATVAFQTFAGQGIADPERKPFQLDRCHALDTTSAVVARYYPKWYTGTEKIEPLGEDQH